MKVRVGTGNVVTLTRQDFIGQGGEGAVYVRGGTAYKVYADPARAVPAAKIDELAVIARDNIVRPLDPLWDVRTSRLIGYTMHYVADTHALCQVFTRAFRQRHNVTDDRVLELVRIIQDGVEYVHAKGILVVDLNEMNFLLDPAFAEVYFIDVDSYQTQSFPATALMDSVRDWHAKHWTTGSDWFSWGVVTFQMFLGVHPYKGKHPSVKTLEERMRANLSVFNADVSIPRVCPPFDVIPEVYRRWYEAVFERGLREPPPRDVQAVAVVITHAAPITSTAKLDVALVEVFRDEVLRAFAHGRSLAALTRDGVVMNRRTYPIRADAWFGVVPSNGHVVAAWTGGPLRLYDLADDKYIPTQLSVEAVMSYDGRIYCKGGESVCEVQFTETGTRILPTLQPVANAMARATWLYEGVAVSDMLGAWYASIFPAPGQSYQVHLKELDGHKVVDAKYDGGVLMVIGVEGGRYDKFVFVLESDYQHYQLRRIEDVGHGGISFVVLETGVCAHIVEDGKLELFAVAHPARIQIVEDPIIRSDMPLFRRGAEVLAGHGTGLFRLSTRKP